MELNKFTAIDLYELQNCLDAYSKLLSWIPTTDNKEIALKDDRYNVISRLQCIAENMLADMKEGR